MIPYISTSADPEFYPYYLLGWLYRTHDTSLKQPPGYHCISDKIQLFSWQPTWTPRFLLNLATLRRIFTGNPPEYHSHLLLPSLSPPASKQRYSYRRHSLKFQWFKCWDGFYFLLFIYSIYSPDFYSKGSSNSKSNVSLFLFYRDRHVAVTLKFWVSGSLFMGHSHISEGKGVKSGFLFPDSYSITTRTYDSLAKSINKHKLATLTRQMAE